MRPEKFTYVVTLAIEHKMKTGSNEKFTKPLLKRMRRQWTKWAMTDDDFRPGILTYAYPSAEDVRMSLFYISDRWQCAFRLKWIIDGIEGGHI